MSADFIDIARQLAQEAGRCVMELRKSELVKQRKADQSLVTNADHAADRIIREGLRNNFPKHAILTEESGLDGEINSEYLWVVDPLDGTRAYAKGIAGFSVMIGLLRKGEPFAGVVYDPWEGHLYEAIRGLGTYHTVNDKREQVTVSKRKEWEQMPLVTSTGFPEAMQKSVQEKVVCPWLTAINSVGIKVGLLVRQEADIYLNHHHVNYWDTAAPQIILEEAGGVFSQSDGQPLLYDLTGGYQHKHPTLATNGRRHSEFVRIIQGIL